MIMEPFARDRVEDKLNPIGHVFHAASTMIGCRLRWPIRDRRWGHKRGMETVDVVMQDGFTRVRQATQTHFSPVLEATV